MNVSETHGIGKLQYDNDNLSSVEEARETDKRSLAGLSGTLAGQTVHAVKDFSKYKCWRCGE
jgi:hypothetical protein